MNTLKHIFTILVLICLIPAQRPIWADEEKEDDDPMDFLAPAYRAHPFFEAVASGSSDELSSAIATLNQGPSSKAKLLGKLTRKQPVEASLIRANAALHLAFLNRVADLKGMIHGLDEAEINQIKSTVLVHGGFGDLDIVKWAMSERMSGGAGAITLYQIDEALGKTGIYKNSELSSLLIDAWHDTRIETGEEQPTLSVEALMSLVPFADLNQAYISNFRLDPDLTSPQGQELFFTALRFHNVELVASLLELAATGIGGLGSFVSLEKALETALHRPRNLVAVQGVLGAENRAIHAEEDRLTFEIVEELIELGADVNYVDPTSFDQQSILHLAVNRSTPDVVGLLVDRGANVNAQDKWGATPLDFATQDGNQAMVAHLQELGGFPGSELAQ